jgi:sulfofructose kinase
MAGERVICVGHTALDRTFYVDRWPTGSAKIAARDYRECGGGMAANAAVAIARLGGAAEFWGPTGDDREAGIMADELARAGVDLAGFVRVPGRRSSVSTILVDAHGERLVVGFRSDALREPPDALPWGRLSHARVLLADVRWPEGAAAALCRARAAGLTTVLDADVAPADVLTRLVYVADHVLFSAPGLQAFRPGEEPAAALRAALAAGASVAGVTQGERGCLWCEATDPHRLHAAPALAVDVVDSTGAGDVFHGAYALGLAERWPVHRAVRFACVAASLKCRGAGARASIPDRHAVEARLRAA